MLVQVLELVEGLQNSSDSLDSPFTDCNSIEWPWVWVNYGAE